MDLPQSVFDHRPLIFSRLGTSGVAAEAVVGDTIVKGSSSETSPSAAPSVTCGTHITNQVKWESISSIDRLSVV